VQAEAVYQNLSVLHAFAVQLFFFTARCAQDLSGGMTLKAFLVKRIPLDAKYAKASRKYGVISRELGTEDRDQNAGNQHNLWINRRIAAAI